MNKYEFKDLFIGQTYSFKEKITEEMLDKFVGISGDINSLHTSEEYAKKKGMKGRVIHGMLASSFYSTLIGVYLPGEKCLLQGIDINFKNILFIGDEIEIFGEIIYLNEAYNIAEIKASIVNQDGKKISTAKIRIGVI